MNCFEYKKKRRYLKEWVVEDDIRKKYKHLMRRYINI